jgi:hypothetical protein
MNDTTSLMALESQQVSTIRAFSDNLKKLPMTLAQREALPAITKTLLNATRQYQLTIAEAEDIGTALIEAEMVKASEIVKYLAHHTPMEICTALTIRAETFGPENDDVVSLPVIFRAMENTGFPTQGVPSQLDYDAVYHEIEQNRYEFSKAYDVYKDGFENGRKTMETVRKFKVIRAHSTN